MRFSLSSSLKRSLLVAGYPPSLKSLPGLRTLVDIVLHPTKSALKENYGGRSWLVSRTNRRVVLSICLILSRVMISYELTQLLFQNSGKFSSGLIQIVK